MNNYSDFYNLIQPFVETGFHVADMFLHKCQWYSEVHNGKPCYMDMTSYAICFDMSWKTLDIGSAKDPFLVIRNC